jgi:glycosyltransferase involved in cell wall biosynthesis
MEPEFAEAPSGEAQALRRAWGIERTAPVVGIVGRIRTRRKGQDVFLRAAALVAARFPGTRFVIVGAPFRGNDADAAGLRVLARELGIAELVTWAGELPETRAAYASMDIVVSASATPEPFGNTTLEAMIQSRPVVGTAAGGTPEQIENGVNGLLVRPDSPVAMADAVCSLLGNRDLGRAMGRKGREMAMGRFSANRMTDDLMRIYAGTVRAERLGF